MLHNSKLAHDTCDTVHTLGFMDSTKTQQASVDNSYNPSFKQGSDQIAAFADFLSRPIEIYTTEWAVAGDINTSIKPWALWATNPHVKKKLDNFYMLRGSLNLRFVINGSPFHYGALMAGYHPLQGYSACVDGTSAGHASIGFVQYINRLSQRLKIVLKPSENVNSCMCLPYFNFNNYLDVTNATEFTDFGELRIKSLRQLAVTSDTLDSVGIKIYAWMENIELLSPTYTLAQQSQFTLPIDYVDEDVEFSEEFIDFTMSQLGWAYKKQAVLDELLGRSRYQFQADELDEKNPGVISGPAFAVARAMGSLRDLPVIGPYAMAANLGSAAVGKIAALFGYSKPVSNHVGTMRRDPLGNIANSNVVDSSNKLAFDVKQGITVDPRATGLDGTDEMSIKYIAQRESFFTYFEMASTDGDDTALFQTAVIPTLGYTSNNGQRLLFQPTALAFATLPFRNWCGTLIFRFEIIATKFHKGRIKIAWDPLSAANTVQSDNINLNLMKIVDIEQTQEFEFVVPWGRKEPYQKVYTAHAKDTSSDVPFTTPLAATVYPGDGYVNGFLGVAVINRLTAPLTTAPIRFNVYIRAGDDFELANPTDNMIQDYSHYELQSAFDNVPWNEVTYQSADGDLEKELSADGSQPAEAPASVNIMASTPRDYYLDKTLEFYGEPLVSFRSLIKRYNFLRNIWYDPQRFVVADIPTGNTQHLYKYRYICPNFPIYYGADPNGFYSAKYGGGANPAYAANPARTTLLNYLGPAYIGWRGGVRYRYVLKNANFLNTNVTIKGYRDPDESTTLGPETGEIVVQYSAANAVTAGKSPLDSLSPTLFTGNHTTLSESQNVLAIELPFYSTKRFALNQTLQPGNYAYDYSDSMRHAVEWQRIDNGGFSPQGGATFEVYVAAGDDFSFNYFLSAPALLYYADPEPTVEFPAAPI